MTRLIFHIPLVVVLSASLAFICVNSSTQLLIILIACLLLLVFLAQPEKSLLGYLIVSSLIDQSTHFFSDVGFGPHVIFRGGLTALLMFYWLFNKRNPLTFKAAIPMFMFLALLTFNTLTSAKLQKGVSELTKIVCWIFLLLTVADMVAQGKMVLKTIYQSLMLSVLIMIISVQVFNYFGVGYSSYNVGEVTGALAPHVIAVCLAIGLIVVITRAIEQQNRLIMLLLLLFGIIMTISLMRTYVRTGYVAIVVVLLTLNFMYWLYRSPRRQRLILGAILVMMIGVISIYIYTHLEAVGQRFSDISESAMESGKIGSGRGSLWKVAFRTYASYSLFGKLFGGGYDTATAFFQGKTIGTHNTYLHILLWAGAAGLYLYLWTFISLWRQMKSATQSDYVPFIIANTVIITYLVAEMTNGVIYYMYVTTFLSFLVGGALGYYKAKENAMPG